MCIRDRTEGIFAETAGGVTIGVLCKLVKQGLIKKSDVTVCLLYTSDAADERSSVDLGGRRIIKKKKKTLHWEGDTL